MRIPIESLWFSPTQNKTYRVDNFWWLRGEINELEITELETFKAFRVKTEWFMGKVHKGELERKRK